MLTKYLKDMSRAVLADTISSDEAHELRAEIEERDAAIERFEQTITELKAQIETLQHALEQAEFKTKILEQSYSTQLREARERASAAEQSMSEQKARIEALETDHEEINREEIDRELAGARSRLHTFESDPVSIDDLLENRSMPQEQSRSRDSDDAIDESVDPEMLEEMLAPDVMFAGKGK